MSRLIFLGDPVFVAARAERVGRVERWVSGFGCSGFVTVLPIQCHPGEGRDPVLERQHPPYIPPLDPGLRRGDL